MCYYVKTPYVFLCVKNCLVWELTNVKQISLFSILHLSNDIQWFHTFFHHFTRRITNFLLFSHKSDNPFLYVFYQCQKLIFIFLKKKRRKRNTVLPIRFNFIPRKSSITQMQFELINKTEFLFGKKENRAKN